MCFLMRLLEMNAFYPLSVLWVWFRQFFHNLVGIATVWDIIKWRPLGPGMIPVEHPWCVGAPNVWMRNVVFRTPERDGLPSTEEVVEAVGKFLANFVRSAAAGEPGRMPWGIRYLHGPVHHNGGWIVFSDLEEAYRHLTDQRFRREILRFAREEGREVVVVLRQKVVDREEYANLISMIRCMLPWFSNSNSPGPNVLWGNPSPYPAINMITGAWRSEVQMMRHGFALARAPVDRPYFTRYGGDREGYRWPELLLKVVTRARIRARGAKGNLYFVDRTKKPG